MLAQIFPKSLTEEWYLIIVNQYTNMMPHERRKYLEDLTGKKWSSYLFERRTNQVYGHIHTQLKRKNLLQESEGNHDYP